MTEPLSEFEVFRDVIHHIFLPPQLPQQAPEEKHDRQINLQLVRSVIETIVDYRKLNPNAQEEWHRISQMFTNLWDFVDISPAADRLRQVLSEMKVEGK